MTWFKRKAGSDKSGARDLLLHHQLMTAMHQFCTETWNDALESVATDYEPGDEGLIPGHGVVSPTEETAAVLGNAVAIQRTVFESAGRMHARWCESNRARLDSLPASADDLVGLTAVLIEVAELRAEWRSIWLAAPDDPETAAGIEDTQRVVRETVVAEALSLRKFMEDIGLDQDDLLATACVAMNKARATLTDLGPLSAAEFVPMYLAGIAGERPRYFS